ncbi:MAG TPA: dTMP kinase [Acidimicrobiales bacterium]|nr:dTMP kinase [Acidimicrobiales bacterium]
MARFIVLEGGEAAGKSTQTERLAAAIGAVATREPGGTALGEALRGLLLGAPLPITSRAETLMMLAARAQHVSEVIEPALARGQDVVCDRYSGSTFAYQGFGRGLDVQELAALDSWATGGRRPDLVVLLDVPVRTGRSRRPGEGKDRFEGEDDQFLERVRQGFLDMARQEPHRWKVVDASAPLEAVTAAVLGAVAVPAP